MDRSFSRNSSASPVQEIFDILRAYKWRWIVPAIVISGAVAVYAFQKNDMWQVAQAVMVRNHAAPKEAEPGEFRASDPMDRTEDTIVEICRSSLVLSGALSDVGPAADAVPSTEPAVWPARADVADLREALTIEAPKGAEFGTTEVFYIKLKDTSRQRAEKLLGALFVKLRDRIGEIRDARARDLVREVEETVAISRENLANATQELSEMEQSVGPDLVELRMLHQAPNGQGDLMKAIVQTEQDIAKLRGESRVNDVLLEMLHAAKGNPAVLESAPPDLVASHPQLATLREAVVNYQLQTVDLRKNLTEEYPAVKAAVNEGTAIHERLAEELVTVLDTLTADAKLRASRMAVLEEKRLEQHARIAKLAAIRAHYSNLVTLVDHRQAELQQAERQLTDVRARQAVAKSANVISKLDEPGGDEEPLGPSRAVIVLAGILGGLISGFGLVLLTVANNPPSNDDNHATPVPVVEVQLQPRTKRRRQPREEEEPLVLARTP